MSTYAKYNQATESWYLINAHNGERHTPRGFKSFKLAEIFATNHGLEFVGIDKVIEANGLNITSRKAASGEITNDQQRILEMALNASGLEFTGTWISGTYFLRLEEPIR